MSFDSPKMAMNLFAFGADGLGDELPRGTVMISVITVPGLKGVVCRRPI